MSNGNYDNNYNDDNNGTSNDIALVIGMTL